MILDSRNENGRLATEALQKFDIGWKPNKIGRHKNDGKRKRQLNLSDPLWKCTNPAV